MTTDTSTARRTRCPACKTPGKRVGVVTLRSMLISERTEIPGADDSCGCKTAGQCRTPTEDTGWRFCDSVGCDVVYFSETCELQFTQSDLLIDVGIKQTEGPRPLCYCFGHSVASIKEEMRSAGRSSALDDIRAKMKDPGCHCATANPSGACCLGNVARGIETACSELSDETPERGDSFVPPNRGKRLASVGTLVSAAMASSCCWLPLLLLTVGVSGAGIATTLEAYRPAFTVVTFGFLSAAFYLTYRPGKSPGTGRDCCTDDPKASSDCCAPSRSRCINTRAMNKVMFWGVTALAVAFLQFPGYVGALFGVDGHTFVTKDMNRVVLHVEGMTCQGCATLVAESVRQVPGVAAVEVSYENSQATIGTLPEDPVPVADILAALRVAGYEASVQSRPGLHIQ